jgi:hypothetical protein
MRLEVGKHGGLFRSEAFGRLDQPAPVLTVSGRQLHKQANSGARLFGLVVADRGPPFGWLDRRGSHLARLLGQLISAVIDVATA